MGTLNTISKRRRTMNKTMKTLAAATLSTMALIALPVWAADEALVVGANAGFDDIAGGGYDPLASVAASVPAASVGVTWNCAVTCSAEVAHELGTGTGTLGILDDGVVVAGSERTFEVNDNAGIDDLSPIVVSTTARTTMSTASDPDTFACAAKEGTGNFDINDSLITVVCTDLP
jgi:hypothetical protein